MYSLIALLLVLLGNTAQADTGNAMVECAACLDTSILLESYKCSVSCFLLGNQENPSLNGSIFALVKELQQKLEHQKIAFTAMVLNHLTTNVGDSVIFGPALINQGNGYDPTTGLFTAPVSGTYSFTLVIVNQVAGTCRISVRKGDIRFCTAYSYGAYQSGTGQAARHLEAGEEVRLYTEQACRLIAGLSQYSVHIINVD